MFDRFSQPKLAELFRRFTTNQLGNISLMAGIAAIPLVIAGGAAIDYERAINAKIELQASLDTAVLFAATQNSNDNKVLTTVSRRYIDANYHNEGDAELQSYAISAGDAPNTLKATGVVKLNTWFMAAVGVYTLDVTATSQALHTGTGRNINLEVSLVLDNTGSMLLGYYSGGRPAIYDLKIAATNFVNTVMSSSQSPYYTKIAIVPYDNGVNMGSDMLANAARGPYFSGTSTTPGHQNLTFQSAWPGFAYYLTYGISNCVTERVGSKAYTDDPVKNDPVGRQYSVGSPYNCDVSPIQPLTTDKSVLLSAIESMWGGGSSAGQVGIAWGWYTLSPNFGLFSGESAPAGYDKLTTSDSKAKVKKIMILMTDGDYNTAYASGVISGKPYNPMAGISTYLINREPDVGETYEQSNKMCAAIKNSGIEVYTIAFQLDKTKQPNVDLLKNCATDASHALDAADQSQLDNVFQTLAQNLVAMRLTK